MKYILEVIKKPYEEMTWFRKQKNDVRYFFFFFYDLLTIFRITHIPNVDWI